MKEPSEDSDFLSNCQPCFLRLFRENSGSDVSVCLVACVLVCLFVCLSACMRICLSASLSVCLLHGLSFCLVFSCWDISQSVYLYVYLYVHVYPYVYLYVCMYVYLWVYLCAYLYLCMCVYLYAAQAVFNDERPRSCWRSSSRSIKRRFMQAFVIFKCDISNGGKEQTNYA